MAINELAFAVAMIASPVGELLELPDDVARDLNSACVALMESIGNVTIDKYDELTTEQVKAAAGRGNHQT